MNKADLVDRIAGACSISKAQATTAIDTTVDSVTAAPAITAPLESVTVPFKELVAVWAKETVIARVIRASVAVRFAIRIRFSGYEAAPGGEVAESIHSRTR